MLVLFAENTRGMNRRKMYNSLAHSG